MRMLLVYAFSLQSRLDDPDCRSLTSSLLFSSFLFFRLREPAWFRTLAVLLIFVSSAPPPLFDCTSLGLLRFILSTIYYSLYLSHKRSNSSTLSRDLFPKTRNPNLALARTITLALCAASGHKFSAISRSGIPPILDLSIFSSTITTDHDTPDHAFGG
ncbi:hypothetical protein L209DRAFT_516728 [Thermothelomyces heterothallicus CBS 203.75]